MMSSAKTVLNAEKSTVSSKMIGKNAGSVAQFMGLPCTIIFELTVLFSAFSTVFALLIMNQLPKWYHPVFNWERFSRVSDDGFFIVIEARDAKFSETKTRALLEEIGGTHVTLIHD